MPRAGLLSDSSAALRSRRTPGDGSLGTPLSTPSTGAPTAPRRVFHLIKGLGRGGAEMLLLELQRRRPSDLVFGYGYLLPWKDGLAEPLRQAGGEVVCLDAPGPLRTLLRLPRLARHLKAWRADLLHCHLPMTGIAGRLAGRLSGVPVLYTEHNLQERYHPATRLLSRLSWGWQERVLAVSGEVAASIERYHGSRVAVRVLHNGVDSQRFSPDPALGRRTRLELGIPANAPVVGAVAVFRRQKNLELWLEAAARLRERHPEARFLLVGDGPLRAGLEQTAARLGLAESVHWPGLVEDPRPYLAAMDLFLVSSDFEGLPVALLEAMAMERPVVATTVGGIPEVVERDVSGRLVPPRDAERLVLAADEILADRELAARLGSAARRRVLERFSLEHMVAELRAMYGEVLDGR